MKPKVNFVPSDTLRSIAKRVLPAGVRAALVRAAAPRPLPTVTFATWEEAKAAAGPYDVPLSYVEQRIRDIRAGAPPTISLAAQLAAVLLPPPPVHILDFGGSLANSYFHLMPIAADRIASWRIVDLPETVARGRELFHDQPKLSFHDSISEAFPGAAPDVVICSGTLYVMDAPYECLRTLFSLGATSIVIDRTSFGPRDIYQIRHAAHGKRVARRILDDSKVAEIARSYRTVERRATNEGDADFSCILYMK